MKVKKYKTFVLLEAAEDNDITSVVRQAEAAVNEEYTSENVVINILKFKTLTLDELSLFLKISNAQRKRKKSFVIINDAIETDTIPDELVVVPTLQEAEDIVEMEEIERDLGF